jgi:NAD(P)-dependent dehydrogenase (short-subunit alcohol dehydrogenase family)
MRRILVTGANKGIGKAIVEAVVRTRDDTEVLLGSRDLARGEAAREDLIANSPELAERIYVLQLDVSSDDSVASAANKVAEKFGTDAALYAIVNNAGTGFGASGIRPVFEVNTAGIRRVCDAFIPMLESQKGRIINITSAAGPNFVSACSNERKTFFRDPGVTWQQIDALRQEAEALEGNAGAFEKAGLGDGDPYGFSKACANSYTLTLAREHPRLAINACTPGFIETDLTRHYAKERGIDASELGMKQPEDGALSAMHLLFGELHGNGHYYGSDAVRSPLDRYRAPGDAPYEGE